MATFRIRSFDERLNLELKKESRRRLGLTKRFGVSPKSIPSFGVLGATNDLWIAAAALESGSILVSNDAHFDVITGIVRR